MRRIVFFCVVALGMPLTGIAGANNFGAIAYDRQTNAYGVAWDFPTQAAANQRALKDCAKNGRSCGIVVQFANQCAAYATGLADAWGFGTGGSRAVAERFAYNYCSQNGKGCQIRVWGCTARPGSGQQPGNNSTQGPGIDRDANRRRAEENRHGAGRNNMNALAAKAGAAD